MLAVYCTVHKSPAVWVPRPRPNAWTSTHSQHQQLYRYTDERPVRSRPTTLTPRVLVHAKIPTSSHTSDEYGMWTIETSQRCLRITRYPNIGLHCFFGLIFLIKMSLLVIIFVCVGCRYHAYDTAHLSSGLQTLNCACCYQLKRVRRGLGRCRVCPPSARFCVASTITHADWLRRGVYRTALYSNTLFTARPHCSQCRALY